MNAKKLKPNIISFIVDDWPLLSGLTLSLVGDLMIVAKAAMEIKMGNANELFKLGFVEIPTWLGAGATNLSIVILFIGIWIALIVGFISRYRYYKDELFLYKRAGVSKYNSGFYKDLGGDSSDDY